ncbi:gluconate 2-dehydrogenase subunit 3 family protein [Cohnella sp. 56]|uniref:gluconate 2-dehydrogenase subunit 3 family protein n=1 Tax=Cohnella sp. 56 TaxID=3113722 RepID=UPI0030E7E2A5
MADNDHKDEARGQQVEQPSRRKFLVQAGYAVGGVIVGGAIGSLIRSGNGKKETAPEASPAPGETAAKSYSRAPMFFTQEQLGIVSAATERIFPEDDTGPGALALGVPFFIDHQLAGEWGFNSREYMSPPFYAGEKVQGYQGRLKRREMFEIGLREMDNYSRTKFSKGFAELEAAQQDEVLKAFEADEVKLTTISASGFFKALRSSTLEGAYSDPLYGGNADMNGWRMKSYPGNQMSYTDVIDKEFAVIAPSSLQDHLSAH